MLNRSGLDLIKKFSVEKKGFSGIQVVEIGEKVHLPGYFAWIKK